MTLFRNPATQRIKPVQIKTLGITESADVSKFRPSTVIRGKRKFQIKNGVAFVGPNVINLRTKYSSGWTAIPDPSNP